MNSQDILEVGSGAGRFSKVVLDKTKANSAESCQAFCKTVTNCKHWTWEMDTTECYAKSGENGTANACPSKYGNELSFNPCYKYVKQELTRARLLKHLSVLLERVTKNATSLS